MAHLFDISEKGMATDEVPMEEEPFMAHYDGVPGKIEK